MVNKAERLSGVVVPSQSAEDASSFVSQEIVVVVAELDVEWETEISEMTGATKSAVVKTC